MIPKTNEVRIETSTVCNARCVFCPHGTKSFTRPRQFMDFKTYVYYLDKVLNEVGEQITATTFSGFGEALLDKSIDKKIDYACKKNLEVHLLTNGSMLKPPLTDKLYQSGIKDIRISLHASNEDSYRKIMRYKTPHFTYQETVSNLEYAIEHKPAATNIIITVDVVEDNAEDIDDLIERYGQRCYLEIWNPHNWVYGKKYRDGSQEVASCGRPFTGPIQIQINGDVIQCCFDFNNQMVLGNFKKQSLQEIYSSPIAEKIRRHHTQGTCSKTDLICNGCDQLQNKENVLIYTNRGEEKNRVQQTSTELNVLTDADPI